VWDTVDGGRGSGQKTGRCWGEEEEDEAGAGDDGEVKVSPMKNEEHESDVELLTGVFLRIFNRAPVTWAYVHFFKLPKSRGEDRVMRGEEYPGKQNGFTVSLGSRPLSSPSE
jgi:hypothetical protein